MDFGFGTVKGEEGFCVFAWVVREETRGGMMDTYFTVFEPLYGRKSEDERQQELICERL